MHPSLARNHIPVLIVGGGLAGLTAAVLLARHRVPCLLVERRPSTARHPRARGVNLRSLEVQANRLNVTPSV
jgi:putative polyketide hydroxylase